MFWIVVVKVLLVLSGLDPPKNGADKRIRTSDLRITNAPLYQLSYVGSEGRQVYSNQAAATIVPRPNQAPNVLILQVNQPGMTKLSNALL